MRMLVAATCAGLFLECAAFAPCAPAQGPVARRGVLPLSMTAQEPVVCRRGALAGALSSSLGLLVLPAASGAEDEKPLIPESEMLKPPKNSCEQGVGGKCTELAEGNPLILKLQKSSAENRLKYQKQNLESYWNRNYKDFFDAACTGKDTKCGFEQTADGKWIVKDKKAANGGSRFALKAFKDRGVDYEGAEAAKGSGIPPAFKEDK
jgi:hypothetical protein